MDVIEMIEIHIANINGTQIAMNFLEINKENSIRVDKISTKKQISLMNKLLFSITPTDVDELDILRHNTIMKILKKALKNENNCGESSNPVIPVIEPTTRDQENKQFKSAEGARFWIEELICENVGMTTELQTLREQIVKKDEIIRKLMA